MTRATWQCSKCGGGAVKVLNGFTALDPRYPTGHCESCTPVPKDGKPRGTVALIRSDDQRALDSLARVREMKRRQRLLRDLAAGTRMSPDRRREAEAILAEQRGVPG